MPVLFPGIAESLNIRLLSAGCIDLGSWWPKTDILRDFWRLYLHDRDGASLALASGRFKMPAGRIVVVPPGLEFRPIVRRAARQLFVQFEFVGWPAEAAREVFPAPVCLPPDAQRDQLAAQLQRQIEQSSDRLDPVLASRVKALVHLTISDALAAVPDDRAGRFLRIAEGQQELLTVLHYIEEHLGDHLNNGQLAELARTSESRFIRRFRDATGRTPGRFIQDRRLRRASDMLVSTDRSIEDIAQACGFANRYHFTRVFSQRMGCPPARYRSDKPYGVELPETPGR
jgi:AraC-like DNA-binding protein